MHINHSLLETWRARLAQQQSSEMTVKAWCQTHGFPLDRYYYWKRRINNPADTSTAPKQWVRVALAPPAAQTTARITLHLGYAKIEVTDGFDPSLLRAVVAALEAPSC